MRRSIVLLLALGLGCTAEMRENTKAALAAYQPTHRKLEAIFRALSTKPEARDCEPRLEGKTPAMVDERHLAAVMGDIDEMENKEIRDQLANWNTSQLGSLPTARDIEYMMEEPDPSHALVIERATRELESVGYVVVARTSTFDLGETKGNTIVRKAEWTGWLFVAALESGEIVGAIPHRITNSDTAYSFGGGPSLDDDLWKNLRGTVPRVAKEHCGIELSM